MELSGVHDTFRHWIQSLQPQGLDVCLRHDLAKESGDEHQLVVSAVLLTARIDPERRAQGAPGRRRSTLPLARLRYLIAVDGWANRDVAEQVLLDLLVRAQRTPGMMLLAETVSSSWWLACGVKPRPAFLLEAAVSETVERASAPPVREIQVALSGMHSVHGRVEAADGAPVAGAEIQLLATGQVVRSDRHGAFRLQIAGLAPGRSCGRVRIRARGTEQCFDIPGPGTARDGWLIHLEQLGV